MTTAAGSVAELDEVHRALADDTAFAAWYRRTVPRVYGYIVARCGSADVAEELTQETYVAAIRQRGGFDGRSDSTTWLCGIARHKLADHFRAQERHERRRMRLQVRQLGDLDQAAVADPDVTARLAIAEALAALPPLQRAVLTFVAMDDLPVADAARIIGKSHGATQSLLFRAREAFRLAYHSDDPRTRGADARSVSEDAR